jgi:hypothetical protein
MRQARLAARLQLLSKLLAAARYFRGLALWSPNLKAKFMFA